MPCLLLIFILPLPFAYSFLSFFIFLESLFLSLFSFSHFSSYVVHSYFISLSFSVLLNMIIFVINHSDDWSICELKVKIKEL
jgi:hypothetical protein